LRYNKAAFFSPLNRRTPQGDLNKLTLLSEDYELTQKFKPVFPQQHCGRVKYFRFNVNSVINRNYMFFNPLVKNEILFFKKMVVLYFSWMFI